MANLGELFGGITKGGMFGNLVNTIIAVVIGLAVFGVCALILYILWKRKAWNLKVEVKIPRGLKDLRGDEEIPLDEVFGFVGAEWCKGSYNSKEGCCWIKRRGMRKSPVKPFDIKRYLQGNNYLTVVQVGANKYLPVLPESYLRMVDDEKGEEAILLRMKVDTSESKAWRNQFEREMKSTYSIVSLFREYAPWISIGLVIFLWGLQFLILYMKIT